MQRDRIVSALEALERRTLWAANLSLFEASITGNTTVKPGDSVPLTITIQNTGDQNVVAVFDVQFRLAPTDAFNIVPGGYNDGGAVSATLFPVDGGVPVGAFHEENLSLAIPGGIAPGAYSLTAFVDSSGKIPENNDLNNVSTTTASLLVISADGAAVIDGTNLGEKFTLSTIGTAQAPVISISRNNDTPKILSGLQVKSVLLRSLGGDDLVMTTGVNKLTIDGGDGNDKIVGGVSNDTLVGGAGKDTLFGGGGNDRLNGNGGNDRLYGEAGSDRLYGYAGNDILDGGSSSDRLEGGDGADVMYGQGGNDKFFARDTLIDQLFGASGTDRAQCDPSDVLSSVTSVETP